jgi:hypothetical protein
MTKPSLLPIHQPAVHALDELRVRGGILLLLGGPGTGKSRVLEHYATTRPRALWAGPVLLYRTDVVNTPLALVSTLLWQMGVRACSDTRSGLRTLHDELPAGTLVLVDDAHRLALHSLDVLRRLHDRTGVRLVLAGPPRLVGVVRDKCIELAHRLHGIVTLPHCTPSDVPDLLQAEGRRPDPSLSNTLYACSSGNLYWLAEGLRLARLEARAHHQRLTPHQIHTVFSQLRSA